MTEGKPTMKIVKRILSTVALAAAVLGAVGTSSSAAVQDTKSGVLATFEGKIIDLSVGWGEARACMSGPSKTTCYRSEAEMDAKEPAQPSTLGRAALGTCATSLRLYDGSSFGGASLSLTTTGSDIALSSYGFASRTSSYRVGSCSAQLKIGASAYPGNTAPNVSSGSMLAGWDNAITIARM
jgi:hypothetical protein